MQDALDLFLRAEETHAIVDSEPMSQANVANRGAVAPGDQQKRPRFHRAARLEQRREPLAREAVAYEGHHRRASVGLECLPKADARRTVRHRMEALEVDPIVKCRDFFRS